MVWLLLKRESNSPWEFHKSHSAVFLSNFSYIIQLSTSIWKLGFFRKKDVLNWLTKVQHPHHWSNTLSIIIMILEKRENVLAIFPRKKKGAAAEGYSCSFLSGLICRLIFKYMWNILSYNFHHSRREAKRSSGRKFAKNSVIFKVKKKTN